MRGRRIVFFGLMALSLFALMYSGAAIFLWIVLFELLILLFGALNILITLTGIQFVQSVVPDSAIKGDTVRLTLQLGNELFFPFAHLTLGYRTIDSLFHGGEYEVSASVLPRSRETVEVTVHCPYRGEYTLGFTWVEATDLFGLLRFRLPFERFQSFAPAKLIVYPTPREIPPGLVVNFETEGPTETSRARVEDISSIADIRQYQDGDPVKHIHWKLSARNRRLMLKQFDGTLDADSLLFVDCTAHGLTGEQAAALEDAIAECATAFCLRMTTDHMPLRMVAFSDRRTDLTGAEPADFAAFHELLARIRFGGDLSFADGIKLEVESHDVLNSLIIVTRVPSDALFETIISLSERNLRITLVVALENSAFDDRMVRMLGEFTLRDIRALTILPGEDISTRLGGGI